MSIVAAYLHFVAIIATASLLACELVLFRRDIALEAARRLMAIDACYGAGAGLIIITGISRVFTTGKGTAFYVDNPVFWTKMALFGVVAILSLPPTFFFLGWRESARAGAAPSISAREEARIRRLLVAEVAVFALIPLAAVLMSRGIGLR